MTDYSKKYKNTHRNEEPHSGECYVWGRERDKGEKQRELQLHLSYSISITNERSKYDEITIYQVWVVGTWGVGRSAEQPVPRLNSTAPLSNTQDQNKGTKLLTERALGFLKRQLLPVIFFIAFFALPLSLLIWISLFSISRVYVHKSQSMHLFNDYFIHKMWHMYFEISVWPTCP